MPNIPNPYAFIPLRSKPERSDVDKIYGNKDQLKSGFIDVHLTTKTKIIIPESKPLNEDNEHKTYPFFRLDDGCPVIPGSTLRGMLRSVYETASNSCMGVIYDDKDTIIDMRVPVYAALKNRGILELKDGIWKLWKTSSYKVHINNLQEINGIERTGQFRQLNPGEKVSFIVNENHEADFSTDDQAVTGFIQFSNPVNRRTYHPRILVPNGDEPEFTWSSFEPYEILTHELDHAGDSSRRTQRDGAEKVHLRMLQLLKKIKSDGAGFIPIWYLVFGNDSKKTCHISPSAIGRINQVKKWKDIAGDYRPCDKKTNSCPACQLFGLVGEHSALGSRVRITDAKPFSPISENQFNFVTLPILSSPKPSAFEFYINKPDTNSNYWNYDFYFVPDPMTRNKGKFISQQILTPRGRKFYWHSAESTAAPDGNQNSTMEALNADQEFCFRVYFDCINQKQIDTIIWILTLGENDADSLLWHKIGHGKPAGYGSIKLTVDRIITRNIQTENGKVKYTLDYQQVTEPQTCPFSKENDEQLLSLLTICRGYARSSADVRYPTGSDGEIYSWFSENRRARGPQVLPSIIQTAPNTIEVTYNESQKSVNVPFVATCRKGPKNTPIEGYVSSISRKRIIVRIKNTQYDFEPKTIIPPSIGLLSKVIISAFSNDYIIESVE